METDPKLDQLDLNVDEKSKENFQKLMDMYENLKEILEAIDQRLTDGGH